jgi:hypothetical protein
MTDTPSLVEVEAVLYVVGDLVLEEGLLYHP